jgi:hypothetical protein
MRVVATIFFGGILAPASFADPCTAALTSKVGQSFSGQVTYVGDGDSLCVGSSSDGATWIEVRLADLDS